MKNVYFSFAKTIGASVILLFSATHALGQCTNGPSNGSSISVIPCGTFAQVGVGSGTYQEFTGLLPGASYTFETCGTPFNSNLTVFSPVGSQIGFDSNTCGDDGSFTGTAFAGTARIHVNEDACIGFNGQSAVLSYRQNNNLVFTSSSADMCPGNQRSLTATPAGGTFSGTGVSGTTFTAPVTTGPYIVTYTYGQCSTNQTINVVSASTAATSVVASPSSVCPGGGTTLSVVGGTLGLGATWTWYEGGCGSGGAIGTGTSISVSPSTTTSYYVQAEGGCNTTACASIQVNVNTQSGAPTSITVSNPNVCSGAQTTLSVNGGSLGTGAQWLWYIGSCGGQLVGGGTSITVNPLSTATYFVRAEGPCNTSTCASVVISVTPSPNASFTAIQSPSGCGTSDGTITVNANGGTAPYSYSWSNGPTTATNPGLPAGPYIVTVTDASGCTDQLSISMNDPGASVVTLSSSDADNIICAGQQVIFTAAGALQYQYYVNAIPVTTQNPWLTTSLQNGDQVTVQGIDANFCSYTSSNITFTVNQNPVVSATVTDPSACGASDGSVVTSVTDGLPPYTYAWSYNSATTSDITGLVAAPYFVTVTDLNGCFVNGTYGLSDPGAAPVSQVSSEDPNNVICEGESVTFTASGSVTYMYYVDGVQVGSANPFTTTTLTNGQSIAPTGTDANGCTATGNIIYMTVNPGPLISLVSNNPNNTICVGQNISFFASGGLTYEFFVNTISQGPAGPTTLFIGSGLNNGDVVTVIGTDANGCDVESASITVTVNPSPVATIVSQQDPSSCGAADGVVVGGVTGGTSPYSYQWAGGPANDTYSGLSAGSYFVTVTDDAGCSSSISASLSDVGSSPVSLVSDASNEIVCEGVPVTFTASGATTYVYYINGVIASTQNPFITSTLQDGDIVAVTGLDLQLCAATSAPLTFLVHPAVQVGIVSSINPSGCQATDGAANTITIGGTPSYNYLWTDGQITPNAIGLPGGQWAVTVTDANGCTSTDAVSLSDIGATVAVLTTNPTGTTSICDGTEVIFTASGSQNYEFFIDGISVGSANPYITSNILNGETVALVAIDVNGCVYTTPGLTYTVNPAPAVALTSVGSACSNDDVIELTGGFPSGGVFTVDYVFNGTTFPIEGNLFFPELAGAGVTNVTYSFPDAVSGCVGSASLGLTVYAAPVVNLGNDTTACVYNLDAGAGYVSYLWCGSNDVSQTITVNTTGNYCVRVEDTNGCFGSDTVLVVVNQLPTPILSALGDTVQFCAGNSVTLTAQTGFVSYNWNLGSVTNSQLVNSEGPVTLSVTNNDGCIGTVGIYAVEVEPMAVSQIQIIGTEPFCFGGSVLLQVEQGYASYLWNTGSTTSAITVTQSGSYWLTTLDGNGCIDSSTQAAPVDILVWNPTPQIDVVGSTLIVTNANEFTSFQWILNGNPIPGANQSQYAINPTGSGNYWVQVTDANNCTGTSQWYELTCCVGITDTEFDGSVNVYPNPNNGEFVLDITMDGSKRIMVELHDMIGKMVWSDGSIGTTNQISKRYDIRDLPSGVYMLRITADAQMNVVKLIKQK